MTNRTLPGGDGKVMALVGLAHLSSHFYQLALPPLFPWMVEALDTSYAALGLVMMLFFVVSGFAQAAAGVLVDRLGGRAMMISGVGMMALAAAIAAAAPGVAWLIPAAILFGLGNSVFHPADLSILSLRISKKRLGRGYAVHSLSGMIGYAIAPLMMAGLAATVGWRGALLGATALGVTIVIVLLLGRRALATVKPVRPAATASRPQEGRGAAYLRLVLTPVALSSFAFFALTSIAQVGMQTYSPPALVQLYGVSLALATTALTLYLVSTACGTLIGGWLADRTQRHDRVAMGGMAVASTGVVLVGLGLGSGALAVTLLILTGLAYGSILPSRDMMIRNAAASGSEGRMFGFVYSGLDLGAAHSPLLFGWLIDRAAPTPYFLGIALGFFLTIPMLMEVRRRHAASLAAQPAE